MKLIRGKTILITAISLITGLTFVDILVNGAPTPTTGSIDEDGHTSETDGNDELSLTSPPVKKDVENDVTPAEKVNDDDTPAEKVNDDHTPAEKVNDDDTPEGGHSTPSAEDKHVEAIESDEADTTTEKQASYTTQDSDDEVGTTSNPPVSFENGLSSHKTLPTVPPSTRSSPTSHQKPLADDTSSNSPEKDSHSEVSSQPGSPKTASSQPALSGVRSSAPHLYTQRESQRYPSAYLAPPIPGSSSFGDTFSSLGTSLMALTQPAELAKIITNPIAHVGDFLNKGLDFLKQLIEPARALNAFQVRKVPPIQMTTWPSLHLTTSPSSNRAASPTPRIKSYKSPQVTSDSSPQMTDFPPASQTGRRYYSL